MNWQRPTFSLIVLTYLGWLGFITVMMFMPGNPLAAMGHFGFFSTGDTHDLIHELVFALIVGTAAVGLASQLGKPKENFTGQLVAIIAWGAMILTAALTNNWVPQPLFIIFGGLTALATILHPARRGLFNWFSTKRINRLLLTLVVIAAAPLTILAFINTNLQIAGGGGTGLFDHSPPALHDDSLELLNDHEQKHSNLGHYRNIAALSFIIILLGLLASSRPRGWRVAAWVAGFLPILLGIASVLLPEAESSLGVFWGVAAVIWGFAFIAVAEVVRR